MGLKKWSKDLGFENFDGISSLLDFEFVAQSLLRLPSSFPGELVLLLVVQKEYMKLNVGKVVKFGVVVWCRESFIAKHFLNNTSDRISMFFDEIRIL